MDSSFLLSLSHSTFDCIYFMIKVLANFQERFKRFSLRIAGFKRKEYKMIMISTKARVVRSMQLAILLLSALIGLLGSGSSLALAAPMKSGGEKWAFTTGSYVSSSPVVVNGVVYVRRTRSHRPTPPAAPRDPSWAAAHHPPA